MADWEAMYQEKCKECEELTEELDEHRTSSKEIEEMLTADLDKAESDVGSLKKERDKLQDEKSTSQTKFSQEKSELVDELESLKASLAEGHEALANLKDTHRKLEQENDDLERRSREGENHAETTETSLEQVIEEKVLLEADLEDVVNDGREKEQRLRDEIRDLSTELTITKAKLTPRPGGPGGPLLPHNGLNSPATPIPYTPGSAAASPLSTRGLAVIGDMLQRVKDMEERLSGCRSSLGQMLSERNTPTKSPTAQVS